jgi:hypothetical protein
MEGDPGECADSVYISMFISGIEPNATDGLLILDPRQGACMGVEPDRR